MVDIRQFVKTDGVIRLENVALAYDASTGTFEPIVDVQRYAKTLRGDPASQDTEEVLYTGRFVATTIFIINTDTINDIANVSIRDGTGLANDIIRDLTITKDSIVPLEGSFNFDTSVIVNVDDANFAKMWFIFCGYTVSTVT